MEEEQQREPVPKKRSLFAKSAIVKRTAESENAVALFSRAGEVQALRLAEEERRRAQRKAEKGRERKRKSEEIERGGRKGSAGVLEQGKRRRVREDSDSEEEEEDVDGFMGAGRSGRRDSSHSTPRSSNPSGKAKRFLYNNQAKSPVESPTNHSSKYSTNLLAEKSQGRPSPSKISRSKVITIGESESEDEHKLPTSIIYKPAIVPIVLGDEDDYVAPRRTTHRKDDEEQLSDEEFPEIVARAKERARQQQLQKFAASNSFAEKNHSNGSQGATTGDVFGFEQPASIDTDPSVEILITSRLEGSKVLKVKRKLCQKLDTVRLTWCDRQNMAQVSAAELRKEIFLTWKLKKVYDSTSGLAFDLKRDRDGKFISEGEGFDEGRIHLEAWTTDTFNAFMKQEEARTRREQAGSDDEEEEAEVVEEVRKIRLIMQAKHMDPFKLVVKATTPISKLIAAFRASKQVEEDLEINLHFDGDILDPALTIEETELDERDTIEVHIR